MDYSGPGSLADIEAAHAMSDEEDRCNDHWPPLESRSCHELAPDVAGPDHRPRTPAATKRTMEHDSDT